MTQTKKARKGLKSATNKTQKTKQKKSISKSWEKFGNICSAKNNHCVKIGTPAAFNIIKNEMTRDKEWYKRVKFLAGIGPRGTARNNVKSKWRDKMKALLNEKKRNNNDNNDDDVLRNKNKKLYKFWSDLADIKQSVFIYKDKSHKIIKKNIKEEQEKAGK